MIILRIAPSAGQDCELCNPRMAAPADKPAPVSAEDVNASLRKWEQELAKQAATEPLRAPGRERETVFRTVVAVEKALAELPSAHAQVAGYLQAETAQGDTTAEGNALAVWLRAKVKASGQFTSWAIEQEFDLVSIWVERNGIIIESPGYQVALNPEPWQEMFIDRLRAGDFPKLMTQ